MGASDSTGSSSGRALSRFKPRRLASVLGLATSTSSYDEPSDNNASPTSRPPSDKPSLAACSQSRTSPSIAGVVSEGDGESRRDLGEFRPVAAVEARRILAIETGPGKRRKSLVELEEMMHGLENATLAPRRRPSLGPLQPLATTPFRPAVDDFDFAPTAQCDRTASKSASPLSKDQPFLATHAYKAFPSSPTMPSISPSTTGCSRFSDEPVSPYFDALQTPRTPQSPASSPISSPVSLASATFATASPHRDPHMSLEPRSPRAFRPHDPLFGDECAQQTVIRSPSGIDIRFPLVFPSRRSPSTRTKPTASIPSGDTTSTFSSTVDSLAEDEAGDPLPTSRVPKPFFASPFPPPCVSLAPWRQVLDTKASLSPCHASSHARQSSPSRPQSVASSSFASSSDDGRRSSLYSSPDTFGLRNSPLPTTVTIVLDDPFSAAFAAGTT